jgi:hypothetical protein
MAFKSGKLPSSAAAFVAVALLVSCCAALLFQGAQAESVTVFAYDVGVRQSLRPAVHVIAKAVPSGTTFLPTTPGNVTNPRAWFDLAPGTYDIIIQEPGYYHFADRIQVEAGNATQASIFLVPVSQGVTLFTKSFSGSIFANLTLPSGVFPFDYASALAGKQGLPGQQLPMYNFGAGTPPTTLLNLPHMYVLSTAQAGTYRFYLETYHSSMDSQTWQQVHGQFSIFAGTDAVTGFKGSIESSSENAMSWYVGDVIVTNPSTGCSTYNWQWVNEYSNEFGFDPTNHGAGDLVLDECYDVSAPALACNDIIYDDHVNISTCGAFGDPHIILFNRTGVTCGNETLSTLIDNQWFTLTSENTLVADGSGATAITAITLLYKSACNPTTIRWSQDGSVNFTEANAPFAGRHRLRQVGNNVYLDALHMRLQVRFISAGVLTFGISIPTSLANNSTGICSESCPPGTLVDTVVSLGGKRSHNAIRAAQDACSDAGLQNGSFEMTACTFDVALTGNANFANAAATSIEVQQEVGEAWGPEPEAPSADSPSSVPSGGDSPSDAPSGSQNPTTGTNSPSDQVPAPSGFASALAVPTMAVLALIAVVQLAL